MRGLEQIAGMGIVLLLSVPASALGQESAIVRGTVTDSTGAVIPRCGSHGSSRSDR